jgi:hypothetical protein
MDLASAYLLPVLVVIHREIIGQKILAGDKLNGCLNFCNTNFRPSHGSLIDWIPAFAGMTNVRPSDGPLIDWIPASAGTTDAMWQVSNQIFSRTVIA